MPDYVTRRAQLVAQLRRRGIADARVLNAIGQVPRELFIPDELAAEAYDDNALPVTSGQTISQPFVVGLMTQMLGLTGDETVLEIGTGTGYQTAILAQLAKQIVTLERIPELAARARSQLTALGNRNIEFHIGDGTLGWPAAAPYDAILVTAGAPEVPSPLYNQLQIGGRLVIPVGDEQSQKLQLVIKREAGPEITDAGGCRFVKLIGDVGWQAADGE